MYSRHDDIFVLKARYSVGLARHMLVKSLELPLHCWSMLILISAGSVEKKSPGRVSADSSGVSIGSRGASVVSTGACVDSANASAKLASDSADVANATANFASSESIDVASVFPASAGRDWTSLNVLCRMSEPNLYLLISLSSG